MTVRSLRLLPLWSLFSFLGLVACGGSSEPPPQPAPPPPEPVTSPLSSAGPTVPVPSATSSSALPAVELVLGERAPAPEKAPVVVLKSPVNQQVISVDKAPDFEVKLDVKGWDIPGPGNHIHLILDNQPYKRIDDTKQPIKLKDIDPNYKLAEGQHVLVAFASRPTHESVKPVGKAIPLAVSSFFIGKKGEVTWKNTDPTLVYSRPKGNNPGPAPDGLLVDFYLANAELGEGKFAVAAELKGPGLEEGKKLTIKEWQPLRIKHPRTGTYSLHLTLLDKMGKAVAGAWNDTTREFQVDVNAPTETHTHSSAAMPASSAHGPAKLG